jgi:hypothetical protein
MDWLAIVVEAWSLGNAEIVCFTLFNLLTPTGHVMHQQV